MDILQLHSAVKSFGKKKVVRAVAFELEKGTILGLFGRNGSGKSTLLKLLFGTLKADSLEMTMNNQKVIPSSVIAKQCIGYVPQHDFLPKHTKVRDVIPLFHVSEATQDAIFYDPTIATMTYKKIGALSLGELKYLEVLLVAHLSHPFLLLDEPFTMLEPMQKERLKEFLISIKSDKGIVITDHYYHDVLDITDQNIVLKDGVAYPIHGSEDLKKFEYLSHRK